jgi:hypothetical protein
MATGRSTQLTRQIGEHLVAAKLGRLGYIATPFAGNVPSFDLLIADEAGNSIPVQVKAINGPSWQFQANTFLEIEITHGVQHVKGKKKLSNPNLVCIFVLLADDERDEFFLLRLRDLQTFFFRTYKGGRRPKNPQSLHCAIWPKNLERFKNNWGLIDHSMNK